METDQANSEQRYLLGGRFHKLTADELLDCIVQAAVRDDKTVVSKAV